MNVRRYLPMVRGHDRDKIDRQFQHIAACQSASLENQKSQIESPPMAIKTEQSKENAYLIRELEAFAARKYPSDVDLRYRNALEKRLYQLLPDMEPSQLVRLIEATCTIDFPNAVDRNFHDQVMERLGRVHHLKDVRSLEIPGHWVNDRKGRAVPAPAAKVAAKL